MVDQQPGQWSILTVLSAIISSNHFFFLMLESQHSCVCSAQDELMADPPPCQVSGPS